MGWVYEFDTWAIHVGTWILGWGMISYSAAAGMILALKEKKTTLQKILALFGTGIVVMMWLVAK